MLVSDIIVAGADESGRGLVIGPMTIGVCAVDYKIINQFREMGLKDSKKYSTQKELFQHAKYIKYYSKAWSVKVITAKVLTNYNKNNMTMDQAEAYAFFHSLQEITNKEKNIAEFQVDNFQAVKELENLMAQDKYTRDIKLIVLPKADTKYIAVSAGSVLARAELLTRLQDLTQKHGYFGSGSTNDKKTITWLKKYYIKHKSWPDIVRTYWKTIKNIEKEIE
ncbi:MAG: ribonuclease HII [Candidatus Heimdallarchaeota archaeon]